MNLPPSFPLTNFAALSESLIPPGRMEMVLLAPFRVVRIK